MTTRWRKTVGRRLQIGGDYKKEDNTNMKNDYKFQDNYKFKNNHEVKDDDKSEENYQQY